MIAAVTGPMASGKNYVCSRFEKEGWVSIDCDKVVHSAIADCRDEIYSAFEEPAKSRGINILNEDGSINRRALGALVFTDAELLQRQECIVHPYVEKKVRQFIKQNEEKNVLINATVLYKTPSLLKECEKIYFVQANLLKRFYRARRRDNMPVSKILARFRAQKGLLKKYRDAAPDIPVEIIKN